jgi:hypothetical protein
MIFNNRVNKISFDIIRFNSDFIRIILILIILNINIMIDYLNIIYI